MYVGTNMDPRAAVIEDIPGAVGALKGLQFFTLMDIRLEWQIASFRMRTQDWVEVTDKYNRQLAARYAEANLGTAVAKHPRALMDKIEWVEQHILKRIGQDNYNCESFTLSLFRSLMH